MLLFEEGLLPFMEVMQLFMEVDAAWRQTSASALQRSKYASSDEPVRGREPGEC